MVLPVDNSAPALDVVALPPEIGSITDCYHDLLVAACPGLLEGLYLHGSVRFGEFHPGSGDVDLVAVPSARPDPPRSTRRGRRPSPSPACSRGCASTGSTSCAPISPPIRPAAPTCPASRPAGSRPPDGSTPTRSHRPRWPGIPLWHMARRWMPVPCGPIAPRRTRTATPTRRRAGAHGRRRWWRTAQRSSPGTPPGRYSGGTLWFGLGVPRLHHLLATGRLTSKAGARRYAIATFWPRWQPVVAEALRWRSGRSGGDAGYTSACLVDVIASSTTVIESGGVINAPPVDNKPHLWTTSNWVRGTVGPTCHGGAMTNIVLLALLLASYVLGWLGRPLICAVPAPARVVRRGTGACRATARSPPPSWPPARRRGRGGRPWCSDAAVSARGARATAFTVGSPAGNHIG